MRKILASAEHVLAAEGFDNFTMAAVAEHAGVSIGAMYRRFASKEQLLYAVKDRMLTQLEEGLAEALREAAGQGLAALVVAYTTAFADAFAAGSRLYLMFLQDRTPESIERTRQGFEHVQRLFIDAASPYLREIHHPEPATALVIVARTIVGAAVQRTAALSWWADISWERWRTEIADMGNRYLTAGGSAPA